MSKLVCCIRVYLFFSLIILQDTSTEVVYSRSSVYEYSCTICTRNSYTIQYTLGLQVFVLLIKTSPRTYTVLQYFNYYQCLNNITI